MSRNPITGDLQQTKGILSEEGRDNYDKAFPPKMVQRGRYKQDKETGKFIPIHEWNAKYASEPKPKGPMVFVKGFDAFESPTSGRTISNHKELQYELESSGCRTYEGREQEQKEVDRHLAEEDKQFEQVISDSVDETAYQIEHNYSRPEVAGGVNFSLGESDE